MAPTRWMGRFLPVALVLTVPSQVVATIYQCRNESGGVVFTDSPAQLEKCSPLSGNGKSSQPPAPAAPGSIAPNAPMIQVPTKPGYPPQFVPAPEGDPAYENNPLTTTEIYPQVPPPQLTPAQSIAQPPAGNPAGPAPEDAGPPAVAPQPQAKPEEPAPRNPLSYFNPLFPAGPGTPATGADQSLNP